MAVAIADGQDLNSRARRRPPQAKTLLKRVAKLSDELCDAIDQLEEKLDAKSSFSFWWSVSDDEDEDLDQFRLTSQLRALAEACIRTSEPPKKSNLGDQKIASSTLGFELLFLICNMPLKKLGAASFLFRKTGMGPRKARCHLYSIFCGPACPL
jgi:hypothetical protein